MLLDRRTFILTAGSFAVAYPSFSRPLAQAMPAATAIGQPVTEEIRFRIAGWDCDLNSSLDDYVIRVGQNWRCAWR